MKQLPEDIQETTISIVFNGKKRGLNELVGRQRKAGQWVDNTGIMVLTTAHYLGRYIHPTLSEYVKITTKLNCTHIYSHLHIIYLCRNIHLYSYPTPGDSTRQFSLTKIEAGAGAEAEPPITVFFYDKHYQTLQHHDGSAETVDTDKETSEQQDDSNKDTD